MEKLYVAAKLPTTWPPLRLSSPSTPPLPFPQSHVVAGDTQTNAPGKPWRRDPDHPPRPSTPRPCSPTASPRSPSPTTRGEQLAGIRPSMERPPARSLVRLIWSAPRVCVCVCVFCFAGMWRCTRSESGRAARTPSTRRSCTWCTTGTASHTSRCPHRLNTSRFGANSFLFWRSSRCDYAAGFDLGEILCWHFAIALLNLIWGEFRACDIIVLYWATSILDSDMESCVL
jgi:hypothetical protein